MTKLHNDEAFSRHIGWEADAIIFNEINQSSNEALKWNLDEIAQVVEVKYLKNWLTYNSDDDTDFVSQSGPTDENVMFDQAIIAKWFWYSAKVQKKAEEHSITSTARLWLQDDYGDAVKKVNKLLASWRECIRKVAADPYVNAFNLDAVSTSTWFKLNRYNDGKPFISTAHPIKDVVGKTFSNTFGNGVQLAFSGQAIEDLRIVYWSIPDKTWEPAISDTHEVLLVGKKLIIAAKKELWSAKVTGSNDNDINVNTDLSLVVMKEINDLSYFIVNNDGVDPAAQVIIRQNPEAFFETWKNKQLVSTITKIGYESHFTSVASNPHKVAGSKWDQSTYLL